ncbi:type II secretion system protein [Bacillus megaterium]|nr:type II secretion system protein [Priestia megaterium]
MARNGGFTLLEMLVVLSIALLLAALAVPALGGIMQQREERICWRCCAPTAACHRQARKVSVFFTEGRGEYQVVDAESGQQIVVRTLPAPWRFQLGTLRNPVVFTDNGNIEQGGTVWVKSSENSYKVTFCSEKGGFMYKNVAADFCSLRRCLP